MQAVIAMNRNRSRNRAPAIRNARIGHSCVHPPCKIVALALGWKALKRGERAGIGRRPDGPLPKPQPASTGRAKCVFIDLQHDCKSCPSTGCLLPGGVVALAGTDLRVFLE